MFKPRIISWNTTLHCNLNCDHCYIDAGAKHQQELTTEEGYKLMDEIASISKPILVLTGGEPLMRKDIFDLASYGTEKGLKVVLGTNGMLIDENTARRLKDSGVVRVAISIDSVNPKDHDEFRGLPGALEKSIQGLDNCLNIGLNVQVNTTVTLRNYHEIKDIIEFAEARNIDEMHLFFLVPTGRGENLKDITPTQYEKMLKEVIKLRKNYKINVKPTCAPQFMRIAKKMGEDFSRYSRGCLAGISYCRINPLGDVTPCPYLPLPVGNVREKSFVEIWESASVFCELREFSNLEGRCGICDYKDICGGCRARSYALNNNYLGEEPWCLYQPKDRNIYE